MHLDVCHQLSDTPIVPVDEDWIIRDLGPHGPTIHHTYIPTKNCSQHHTTHTVDSILFVTSYNRTSHIQSCIDRRGVEWHHFNRVTEWSQIITFSRCQEFSNTSTKSHEPRCQKTTTRFVKKPRTTLSTSHVPRCTLPKSHEPRCQKTTNHVVNKPRVTLSKSHEPRCKKSRTTL